MFVAQFSSVSSTMPGDEIDVDLREAELRAKS